MFGIDNAGTPGALAVSVHSAGFRVLLPKRRVYAASGNWAKPDNLSWIEVEAWGGGAGSRLTTAHASRGGGGGGYARAVIAADDLAASVAITVGAGGAGSSQVPGVANSGGAGGDSSFGAHCVARGGGRDSEGAIAGGPNYSSSGGGHYRPHSSQPTALGWSGGTGGNQTPIVWAASGGGSVSIATVTPPAPTLYHGGRGGAGSVGAGGAGNAPGGGGGGGLTSQGAGARGEVWVVEHFA